MQARTRFSFILAALLLAGVTGALADDKPAATAPAEAAAPEERLSFNGYFNVETDYQLTQQGLGDRKASVDIDVFELLINYKGADKFRVSAAIDYEHGVDTEFAQGEMTTGWLFLEYAFSNALKLRAGKMLTPFGVYNEIHGAKNLFLSRDEPRSTLKPYKVTKNGFRYTPKWEAGLEVLGEVPIGKQSVDYLLIVGNGSSQSESNPYESDNNTRKSVTARLQYQPLDGLLLGVSGYHDDLTLKTASGAGSLNSLGAHARWNGNAWKLLYEVARGKQRLPAEAGGARTLGQVFEVGYTLSHGLTPYFQWQNTAAELGSTKERASAYIAGVDIPIGSHFVYKIQDAYWTGNAGNKRFSPLPGRRYNELNMAFFYAF